MSSELTILAYYGLLVCIITLVQVLIAAPQVGLPYLSSARDEARAFSGVPARAVRCLENSVVALALFAPAILILQAKGAFSETTLLLAQVFLAMRVLYTIVYLAGIPWVRTIVWLIGFAANVALLVLAL